MNHDDATQLAQRYKNVWRGGPAVGELVEQLAEMTHERARQALNQLARTTEHPPTIAAIWRQYEATHLATTAPWQKPDYSDATDIDSAIDALTTIDPEAAANIARLRRGDAASNPVTTPCMIIHPNA